MDAPGAGGADPPQRTGGALACAAPEAVESGLPPDVACSARKILSDLGGVSSDSRLRSRGRRRRHAQERRVHAGIRVDSRGERWGNCGIRTAGGKDAAGLLPGPHLRSMRHLRFQSTASRSACHVISVVRCRGGNPVLRVLHSAFTLWLGVSSSDPSLRTRRPRQHPWKRTACGFHRTSGHC